MSLKHIFSTSTPLTTSTPVTGQPQEESADPSAIELSPLKKTYPVGSIINAFVTNVHNVTQLRFFMFAKNAANAQHFANIRNTTTPPTAYNCLRMPGEGVVFGLRLGESTVVRAVRLRTMCITTTREVFLPDVGRNQVIESTNSDMYHLPLKLRKAPGIAVCCQLRGINDDVTIVPDNMRTLLKGLLFRSVKLRVDGYIGAILKVQLMDVSVEDLKMWSAELGREQNDFIYALHNVTVVPKEPKYIDPTRGIKNRKKDFYAFNLDGVTETPKRLKEGFDVFKKCLPPINEVSGLMTDSNDDDSDDDDTTETDKTEETDDTDEKDDVKADDERDEENENDDENENDNKNLLNNSISSIDVAELFELGKTPEETVLSPIPSPPSTPSPTSSTVSSVSSPMATPLSASSSSGSSWYSWFSALNTIYYSVMSIEDDLIDSPTKLAINQPSEGETSKTESEINEIEITATRALNALNSSGVINVGDSVSVGVEPVHGNLLQVTNTYDSDWLKRRSRATEDIIGRPIRGGLLGECINILDQADVRPILGRTSSLIRPILGWSTSFCIENNNWKRDFLPALAVIDNRNSHLNCGRDNILTITPTYIGQLERFFGVVHHRGECYLQHMWTEDEIPWATRYTDDRTPYIFDVVLAKHGGDLKWYRAKVIEILKDKKMVRVFFVDYGGEELIQLRNLANLGRTISKLPFQATLFRLHDLIDATTTKNERALGIDILRKNLLKETMSVRVIKNEYDEVTICFDDARFSNLRMTMIRKGFLRRYNALVW